MKKFICFILSAFLMCCALAVPQISASAETTPFSYIIMKDGTAKITEYLETKTTVDIPSEIDGYTVSSIGSSAFENKALESITIPNTVTTIEEFAFATNQLVSVNIPNSVETIGIFAFYNCPKLKTVTLPENLVTLPMGLFAECPKLSNVKIPESVTSIGDSAFSLCKAMTSLTIPDSVTYIGFCAFCNCSGLTEITLPPAVKTLGENAFLGCSKLKTITIENAYCDIFYSTDTIPENATVSGYDNSTAQAYAENYSRSFSSLGTAPEPSYTLGDVDLDGEISVLDASAIQLYLVDKLDLTDTQKLSADTDKDNTVSVLDASSIQLYLVGKISEF